MDTTTLMSSTSEAKVIYELTKLGYHVFNQVSGKAPIDLIAYKDKKLYRISVKCITGHDKKGNYITQLKRVRSNRSGNTIYNFDNNECDILAIYIYEKDKIVFLDSKTINVKSTLKITNKMMEEPIGVVMSPENSEVNES